MTTTYERPNWGEEPFLREAMLGWLKRMELDAVVVQGYREFSYNIGYCSTCSDFVTAVEVYYNTRSGALRSYEHEDELGALIRELTAA